MIPGDGGDLGPWPPCPFRQRLCPAALGPGGLSPGLSVSACGRDDLDGPQEAGTRLGVWGLSPRSTAASVVGSGWLFRGLRHHAHCPRAMPLPSSSHGSRGSRYVPSTEDQSGGGERLLLPVLVLALSCHRDQSPTPEVCSGVRVPQSPGCAFPPGLCLLDGRRGSSCLQEASALRG